MKITKLGTGLPSLVEVQVYISPDSIVCPDGQVSQKQKPQEVRFQYDGDTIIESPQIITDKLINEECRSTDLPPQCEFCSNHVVKTGQIFKSMLLLKKELIPGKVYCDIVEDDTSITVVNNIGLNPNVIEDEAYIKKLTDTGKYNESLLKLLSKCVSEPCAVNVKRDIDDKTDMKSRARVEEDFIAGFPTIADKKMLLIKLNKVEHNYYFVITGDKMIPGGKSFGFPTHQPLLVIRGPVSLSEIFI